MTVEALLELSRAALGDPENASGIEALADGVIELLGESLPCGLEAPEVHPDEVYITREMAGRYTPDEARAMARALLRAADEASGRV